MIEAGPIPKIAYREGPPSLEGAPLVAAGVVEGARPGVTGPLRKAAESLVARDDFRGEAMEHALLYDGEGGPERLLLVGLGKKKIGAGLVRRWAARAAREARRVRVSRIALLVPDGSAPSAERITAAAHGALLGARRRWKEKGDPPLEEIVIHGGAPEKEGERAVGRGLRVGEAVLFARTLAMEPPNRLSPEALAEEAGRIAGDAGASIRVLDEKEIEKEGLLSLLAVGSGSARPPRLIRIGRDRSDGEPVIAFVGKGITFDSGGLSLKSPERMAHMKYDMSGAAAVLAAVRGAFLLELPLNLAAVVPAAENMPGPASYRPGDVIPSYKGLTVEVDNTDAEGRLILADGLAWTEKESAPETMIDVATLTGACKIALGKHAAGIFSTDDRLAAALTRAGEACGERLWRMPLWKDYDQDLESDVADMKNIARSSATGGGAAVAARFLHRFVEKTRWAHIDIAGMAWASGAHDLGPGGSTGFGAGLLLTYLCARADGGTERE